MPVNLFLKIIDEFSTLLASLHWLSYYRYGEFNEGVSNYAQYDPETTKHLE